MADIDASQCVSDHRCLSLRSEYATCNMTSDKASECLPYGDVKSFDAV